MTKSEYLGGTVYAIAGASEAHNEIAMNLYRLLSQALRSHPCRPFGSDMKLRLARARGVYHYYPDAMIVCDPADSGHPWRERPSVLIEIVSESTRNIDERDKRDAYREVATLSAYVRIEQGRPEVLVELRTAEGWRTYRQRGLEAVLRLTDPLIELPLAELYEGVTLEG